MDAPLMFEVLIYINFYYFGLYAGAELFILFAKFNSPNLVTPNIHIDGAIIVLVLLGEFVKVTTFTRLRETRKGLSNVVAISLTLLSILGMLYVFIIQKPVIKIEYTLCTIAFMLFMTEFVYGFLQFLPCCKKKQFEE